MKPLHSKEMMKTVSSIHKYLKMIKTIKYADNIVYIVEKYEDLKKGTGLTFRQICECSTIFIKNGTTYKTLKPIFNKHITFENEDELISWLEKFYTLFNGENVTRSKPVWIMSDEEKTDYYDQLSNWENLKPCNIYDGDPLRISDVIKNLETIGKYDTTLSFYEFHIESGADGIVCDAVLLNEDGTLSNYDIDTPTETKSGKDSRINWVDINWNTLKRKHKTFASIGRELGCSAATVSKNASKVGITKQDLG